MQASNPIPRPHGRVVEVLDINNTILGNCVWYGTTEIRIPVFGTGVCHYLSTNGVDTVLIEEQRLEVKPGVVITFDLKPPPSSEPAEGVATESAPPTPAAA